MAAVTDSDGNLLDLDPAINDTLAGTIEFSYRKMLQNTDGMLPAKVVSYNRTTNRAVIQILITRVSTNGTLITRPIVANAPVLLLGGGGYFISFPLVAGSLGWLAANDRDISNFVTEYDEVAPATLRVKSFNDGVFIPDIMTSYTISPSDAGNAVIQSADGTIKIALTPLGVVITGGLAIEGGITATGGSGATPINLTGNVILNGHLQVIGNIDATGMINPGSNPPP